MWNRIVALMVLVTSANLLLTSIEVEARGGGRGGGGGGRGGGGRSAGGARGGGAYRGGNTMNRTPTMSRASSRPATSQAIQRPQTRPSGSRGNVQRPQNRPSGSQGNVQRLQNRPSGSRGNVQRPLQNTQQRPSAANRAELRNQVSQYAQSRPGRPAQNVDRQNIAQKTQNFSSNRGNQITQNKQLSVRASQNLQRSRPNSNHWFDRDFYNRHNINYVGTGANLWRPAAWSTLAGWGAWQWSTPYYYDSGGYAYPITTAESTYAYPSTTTTPSQPVQTEPTQPTQMAQTTASADEDWLPLGVFAVASNANAAAQTNRFIQLAINRSGEIAGVLYNSTTDAAYDLTGMVDPNNQMAYWSMTNRTNSPVASTGIYNLTEDQTPINVHFADGSDQTWSLVRLQQGQ